MRLRPEELTDHGYVRLDRLEHHDLTPFIGTYMRKWTGYAIGYYLCNILLILLTVYLFMDGFRQPDYRFEGRFTQFSYGTVIAFLLIPLHEYIHVLAYRSQGAMDTSYDANLKKFYFMALADRFVADRQAFRVVALAPFAVITAALTALLPFVHPDWILTIISVMLMHTAMCMGDFGLLSYFQHHRDKDVVTYDDVENKVSYFYARPLTPSIAN